MISKRRILSADLKPRLICFPLLAFLALLTAVLLNGLDPGFWSKYSNAAAQGIFILVWYFVILSLPDVSRFCVSLPRVQAGLLCLFVFAFTFAHFYDYEKKTFPFVKWKMYGRPPASEVVFFSYEGIHADGNTSLFPVNRFVRPLEHGRLHFALLEACETLFHEAGGKKDERKIDENRRWLDAAMRSLILIYNQRHPHAPLTAIRIYRSTVDRQDTSPRQIVREFAAEMENGRGSS